MAGDGCRPEREQDRVPEAVLRASRRRAEQPVERDRRSEMISAQTTSTLQPGKVLQTLLCGKATRCGCLSALFRCRRLQAADGPVIITKRDDRTSSQALSRPSYRGNLSEAPRTPVSRVATSAPRIPRDTPSSADRCAQESRGISKCQHQVLLFFVDDC